MKRFVDFLYSASIRQWSIILGSIPFTCILIWVIYLIRNGWDNKEHTVHLQLTALTWIAYLLILAIILFVVALTSTRFRATGPGGFSADVGNEGPSLPIPPNTTITETVAKTTERKDAKS